jgi:hypothetical protein
MPAILFAPVPPNQLRERDGAEDLSEGLLVLGLIAAILRVTLKDINVFVNFLLY